MLTYEDARHRDIDLKLGPYPYRGRSVGSYATCHQFPGFDLMFDVGLAGLSSIPTPDVFVTHGHDDHIGGLTAHHMRRDGWGLPPARYYVQEEDIPAVRDMVRAQCRLNRSPRLAQTLELVPVGPGTEFQVGHTVVRPFRTTHRAPCVGYGVWETRNRAKPEFSGASREVILAAKARGVSISEPYEACLVAFPGDTTLGVLDLPGGEAVRSARVLLLECTFVDGQVSPRDTLQTGHVHIEHFIQAAKDGAFDQNEVILLTHFSARYRAEDVRTALEPRLQRDVPPEVAAKVQLLLPPAKFAPSGSGSRQRG